MGRIENCPYCGCKLRETTYGRLWCPNCGKIDEELPKFKKEEEDYVN